MEPANEVRSDIYHREANGEASSLSIKLEDSLTPSQKNEIKRIFLKEGIELNNNAILQYKEESDEKFNEAGIGILSCASCPIVVPSRGFWKLHPDCRKVGILHEIAHLRHEDNVTCVLMTAYWDYVAHERQQDQSEFEKIFNKFKKFHEKRADIEALLLSSSREATSFLEQKERDASVMVAHYIITIALDSENLTDEERTRFNRCLQYLDKKNINEGHSYVQSVIDEINDQKDRFCFLKTTITSQSPGFPCRPDYPSQLERLEYCSNILEQLHDSPSFNRKKVVFVSALIIVAIVLLKNISTLGSMKSRIA